MPEECQFHAHDGAEGLEPEGIGEPPQELGASVMQDDRLGDDGAELRHPRRQPGRYAAIVQRKIGGAGASGHRGLYAENGSGTSLNPGDDNLLAAFLGPERAEGDRIAECVQRRDAVLPVEPRRAAQKVGRTRRYPLRPGASSPHRPCAEDASCKVHARRRRPRPRTSACPGASRFRRRCVFGHQGLLEAFGRQRGEIRGDVAERHQKSGMGSLCFSARPA